MAGDWTQRIECPRCAKEIYDERGVQDVVDAIEAHFAASHRELCDCFGRAELLQMAEDRTAENSRAIPPAGGRR